MTDYDPNNGDQSQRVLVVDDNELVRKTLARSLHRLGYVAIEAGSGAEALEILASEATKFDCMVIDRVMPGLSGTQLIHRIRATDTDVPIVLTTGFGDTYETPPGMICGVLAKPWTAADLKLVMCEALDKTSD